MIHSNNAKPETSAKKVSNKLIFCGITPINIYDPSMETTIANKYVLVILAL